MKNAGFLGFSLSEKFSNAETFSFLPLQFFLSPSSPTDENYSIFLSQRVCRHIDHFQEETGTSAPLPSPQASLSPCSHAECFPVLCL